MATYSGRIELTKELSHSQAQTLKNFINNQGLQVTDDGHGIIWDKKTEEGIEELLATTLHKFFPKWGIIATGVLHAVFPKRRTYDIVVIANKVKIYENNEIRTVEPTNI